MSGACPHRIDPIGAIPSGRSHRGDPIGAAQMPGACPQLSRRQAISGSLVPGLLWGKVGLGYRRAWAWVGRRNFAR